MSEIAMFTPAKLDSKILTHPARRFPLNWVEVRLDLLRKNLRAIQNLIPDKKTEVLAVVKADAYGHGMKRVGVCLADAGVNFFGVANIEEALELRSVCSEAKILVLGTFHGSQIPLYREFEITPTVSSSEDIQVLSRKLRGQQRPFPIHVKIDTGMSRLGIWHRESAGLFQKLRRHAGLWVEGIYTHFARADHRDGQHTQDQLRFYNVAVEGARRMGFNPRYLHAANSLGLLRFKEAHFNLVRPGIVLYGLNPDPSQSLPKTLRPILSWKTKIAFLKKISRGSRVSYGGHYRAKESTTIATLPVGYSHGYRVALSGKSEVLIRGRRCPVAGRVTMDQTMVDVGALSNVRRWETVTLLGAQGSECVSAPELAQIIGTIPYEVVCSIHSRVGRLYRGK